MAVEAGERPNAAGRRPVGEIRIINVRGAPPLHNDFVRRGGC